MSIQEMMEALEYMRIDSAVKNKKGIAFIAASIFIWAAILGIYFLPIPQEKKNLYTWIAVAFLMPIAFAITKFLKLNLQNNDNPLNKVGVLFTLNEILYILIVCWVYSAVPEKMIMVLAMIFGGHLLPFGWLYKSKSYTYSSIIVTLSSLIIGCTCPPGMIALFMLLYEIVLTACLFMENKRLSDQVELFKKQSEFGKSNKQ